MKGVLRKNSKIFLLSLIPVVITGIMAPMRSYVMQLLIDSDGMNELIIMGGIAVVFSAGIFVFEWICKKSQAYVVRNMETQLRTDLMKKLFSLSAHQYEKKGISYYISKFTTDIKMILDDGINNIYGMIMQAVFFVIAVIYLLSVEPFILLIVGCVSAAQFFVPQVLKKKIQSARKLYTEAVEIYLAGVKDDLGGHKVIRTFYAIPQILKKQESLSEFISKKNESSSKTMYWAQALASLVNNGAFLIVLCSCMFFAVSGRVTIGEVVAITNMMNFVLTPCRIIADGMIRLKALEKVNAELEQILAIESDSAGKQVFAEEIWEIRLEDTSQQINDGFGLQNISHVFEKAKKYAIVGKSGSGKSSLIRLLTEYGIPYSGHVWVNNKELAGLDRESIMHVSPVCYQQTYVFNDTVFHNVTLYQDFSEEEVTEALEKAGIYDTIQKLPDGIHEVITENGTNFSGGELQRIALARLFVRKKDMAFLDEITSGLDNITAYEIESRLLEEDMTVINVTHRYNKAIMQKYDEIIVMDSGRIAEYGAFDELIARQGLFYELYNVVAE